MHTPPEVYLELTAAGWRLLDRADDAKDAAAVNIAGTREKTPLHEVQHIVYALRTTTRYCRPPIANF